MYVNNLSSGVSVHEILSFTPLNYHVTQWRFQDFSVKVSPMWFFGPWRYGNVMTWWYEGRVATDMRIWGCSTCQNKGPPHLLLDIAQLIPQLVLFSILSHPLSSTFGILRLRHISDKFRNQLIVYYQYWAIEMISIPKRNSSLTFWKVTVWLCHCVT